MRGWRGSMCRCTWPNLPLGVLCCSFFRTGQGDRRWPGHRLALGLRAAALAGCLLFIDIVLPDAGPVGIGCRTRGVGLCLWVG